jgi:hypothetical protein
VRTHKFLAKGALGPLSGFAWPVPTGGAPGAWVEVDGVLTPCVRGVHVCRPSDLAHWIHDELWEVQADGDPIEGLDCLIVQRARLVRPIEAWGGQGARRFVDACVEHATTEAGPGATGEARGVLEDARFMANTGYVALTAYTAAIAVSRAGAEGRREDAYRRERVWQSSWIAERLLATPGM